MVSYPRLARFNYLQRPKNPLVCILRRNQGGGGVVKQPTLNSYRKEARDGVKVFFERPGSTTRKKQPIIEDVPIHAKTKEKISNVIKQRYLLPSDRRSCNELQSNLVMINHYVAFYHKILNKNFMSIVKMKYMYVYGSYPNPSLVFVTI